MTLEKVIIEKGEDELQDGFADFFNFVIHRIKYIRVILQGLGTLQGRGTGKGWLSLDSQVETKCTIFLFFGAGDRMYHLFCMFFPSLKFIPFRKW